MLSSPIFGDYGSFFDQKSKKTCFSTLNIKRSIKAIAILLEGSSRYLSTLIIVAYNICKTIVYKKI
jgi:hypothetical protein